MSAVLPLSADSGCCNPCEETLVQQVQGPQGDSAYEVAVAEGFVGTEAQWLASLIGADGQNAYTTLTAGFTMPAELGSASAAVASSSWMSIGQVVFVQSLGYLEVTAKADTTHATLKNLENTATGVYALNAAPGTVAGAGSMVAASGLQGVAGALTGAAGGDLKGTYPNPKLLIPNAKGALAVGNGTDAVSLAVGANDTLPIAASAVAAGIKWAKKLVSFADPLVDDNRVPRLDTTTGDTAPVALQSSDTQIGDKGVNPALILNTSQGNARGTDAVDLQVNRSANGQVASGNRSFIGAGEKNTSSGTESFVGAGQDNISGDDHTVVGGGDANNCTGKESVIAGGKTNTAGPLDQATIGGGLANTVTVLCGTIAGGANNVVSGSFGTVPGGFRGEASHYGEVAHAAGLFANTGDAQVMEVVMRNNTTNATPTELFLDGASLRLTIPTGTTWMFEIMIAVRTSAGASAIYSSIGEIQNDAGTVTANAITTTEVYDGATLPAAPVTVAADNINDALTISVVGVAATLIRWVASVRIVQVKY